MHIHKLCIDMTPFKNSSDYIIQNMVLWGEGKKGRVSNAYGE